MDLYDCITRGSTSTESAAGDLMGTAKEPKERVARMAESQPVRDSFIGIRWVVWSFEE